jgi:hypothetical protein
VEIGIHTFGELVPDPHTHQKISARERLKQMIRMAVLADEAKQENGQAMILLRSKLL